MAATLRLDLTAQIADLLVRTAQASPRFGDVTATQHDYVDGTPRSLSTAGAIGFAFVTLETSVQQVERLVADLPLGTDLVLRSGGLPALLLGSAVAPVFAGGETLQLVVDADGSVLTTFQAGDNTPSLAARRINYAHGRPVADVDPLTGRLRLVGFRTGGADAESKGWGFGKLAVLGGTALTQLGLVAGSTYGQGDDQRVGAGPFAKTFPAGALPRRLELSGSTQGARFWIAGKAS